MPCCFLRSPEQFLQFLLCLPFAVAVEVRWSRLRISSDPYGGSAVAAVTVDDDAAEVDILCCAILYGFFCCFYRQITIYCIVFLLLFLRQLRNIRMGFAGNVENAVIAAPVLVPPGISMQTYRVNLIVVRIFLLYVIFKRGANITIGT